MINHDKVKSQWNRLHFLIYLYINVSKEDATLKEEELRVIYNKLTALNINYTAAQTQVIFKDVVEEHSQHSEEEMQLFISQYCSTLFRNEESIQKLMADLDDIINADGYVNCEELDRYRMIKRILSDALIAKNFQPVSDQLI